jgi:NADPH:quinone reductase-like Zn-dependent oxidoreductase
VRAACLHEIGGIPRVDEIDAPQEGDVLEVSMSSLNPVDIAIGNGRFYGGAPETPYVIGSEAVGRTSSERRLWYFARGTMAERVAITDQPHAIDIPDGVDDATAVACGCAGVTGWIAVSWRARVTPEDTVLVLGASGSVGSVAVQGAKLLGAKRVIGAARHTERVPGVADDVVKLEGDYTLPEASVVVDALWGEPAERALAAAARGVRFVHLGQSAGAEATFESAWVRGKVASILGHSLFSVPPDTLATAYRELCELARDGRIQLTTETFGLDDIGEAWQRLSSGSPGAKIAVSVR